MSEEIKRHPKLKVNTVAWTTRSNKQSFLPADWKPNINLDNVRCFCYFLVLN